MQEVEDESNESSILNSEPALVSSTSLSGPALAQAQPVAQEFEGELPGPSPRLRRAASVADSPSAAAAATGAFGQGQPPLRRSSSSAAAEQTSTFSNFSSSLHVSPESSSSGGGVGDIGRAGGAGSAVEAAAATVAGAGISRKNSISQVIVMEDVELTSSEPWEPVAPVPRPPRRILINGWTHFFPLKEYIRQGLLSDDSARCVCV